MLCAKLTVNQANLLRGVAFAPSSYYNPIEDASGNIVISLEEVEATTDLDFIWVKELPQIEYIPKPFVM